MIGIVMGSESDRPQMSLAERLLDEWRIPCEVEIVSAHRTPEKMFKYGREAQSRGLSIIIAGAGGSAHLPGMLASLTTLPVLGVAIASWDSTLGGIDALLSMLAMPRGVPLATFGVGRAGSAALFALRILALHDEGLREKLQKAFAE